MSKLGYNWDGEGNISGCWLCMSFNTTYGELVPEANTSLLIHFNENNGLTAYDDSSNTNDGTLIDGNTSNSDGVAPPQWVPGKFGNALKFDGSDDYVSLQPESLEQSQFTITAWVYPIQQKNHSIFTYLYGQIWDDAGGYRLFISSENHIGLEVAYYDDNELPGKETVEGTIDLPLNQWSFVAGTSNGSTMKVYVNGQFDNSGPGSLYYSGNEDGYIGRQVWNSYPSAIDYFNGTIDEVALYDRMLSIEEIQRHYNKSLEDGSRNVTVYATDNGGNLVSYTQYFTVHTTPPSINIISPPNDTITDTTPDLNLTTDELTSITYFWDNEGNISGCQNCTSYNTTYGESVPDADTALLMHFNENNGSTAYDDASNNDGTINGATWSAGRFGPALDFNGTNDFVNISDSQSLDLNGAFTLTAWIYSTNSTDVQTIIYKIDTSPAWHGYHFDLLKAANSMKLRCMSHNTTSSGNWGKIKSNDPLTVNEWHFVACVRNTSAGKMELYVDGEPAATPTTDNSLNKDIINDNPLFIGGREDGTNLWIFNGTIDEVAIYNRALLASEIQELYNKTISETQHSVTVHANETTGYLKNSVTRYFAVM